MDHAELIERLGGYRALADKLGRHPTTVFKWQSTGIPADLWPAVLRLCHRRIKLTYRDLEEGSPKEPVTARAV